MADDKDDKGVKNTPAAGKGGSPASSTPNEEGRGSGGDDSGKGDSKSRTPKEGKESAGGKGGGLH